MSCLCEGFKSNNNREASPDPEVYKDACVIYLQCRTACAGNDILPGRFWEVVVQTVSEISYERIMGVLHSVLTLCAPLNNTSLTALYSPCCHEGRSKSLSTEKRKDGKAGLPSSEPFL